MSRWPLVCVWTSGYFDCQKSIANACQVAQALAVDGLGLAPGGRGAAPRVRVAVGRLERGYVQSLRMSHSVGFDDDADESILLPLDGSVAGAAWRRREKHGRSLSFSAGPRPARR